MAWTALALLTSKLLALISQVALGYFLTVETYSFFALISTAMIFVTGLQSPGVNKLLIQEQDRFDTVFTSYLSFGLVMGVLGSIGLLLTGVIFQILYDKPHFFGVARDSGNEHSATIFGSHSHCSSGHPNAVSYNQHD